jgi:hypothetical protein
VDWCAHEVVLSQDKEFKKLDSLLADNIVGDGTCIIVGPFEEAKARFFRGQVTLGCNGVFLFFNVNLS